MAIAVGAPTNAQNMLNQSNGAWTAKVTLPVSGLAAGANNTIPHGLPRTPRYISYRGLGWSEQQSPNAVNIYVNVAAGGAAAGELDVEY